MVDFQIEFYAISVTTSFFLLLVNQYVVTYAQFYKLYNILQIIKYTTYRFNFGTLNLLGHISK